MTGRAPALVEVPPGKASVLRPLYDGFPGLDGLVDAILEGRMGRAYTDDPEHPAVALLRLDFTLLAGDPAAPAAEAAVRAIEAPASVVASDPAWEPVLRRMLGKRLQARTRTAVWPGHWDREKLRRLQALPDGFAIKRITAADVERFAALEDSLVQNFPSLEEFVAGGVGFGVENGDRFVSGCSSFAISSRKLEFEIRTHPDYRRRGLAAAAAAAMIEHCLDTGLEPCWDAHNEMSLSLALKLGFRDPAPYTAYQL
jgi:GNAT superfamily N-acetyltransferase